MQIQQKQKKKVESLHTIKIVDGKYQIKQKQLGQGSFAKTYLSLDVNKGSILACKMISKQNLIAKINLSKNKTLTKEYFVNALKTQVKTWKLLHHPNIVEFADFSQTANNIYFFLEYCAGGTLQRILKKKVILQQEQALRIFSQITNGCQYLYNKGVFHRDLKPENILLTAEGRMKISDFGFAKIIEEEQIQQGKDKDLPIAGTCVGTPIYMSPQVLLGQPYTIKCDVWSLGVMFYKSIFGLIPWEQTQNFAILTERMKEPVMFPPNSKVDGWIKEMIKGMLQVQESKRLSIKQVKQIIDSNYKNKMQLE